MGADRDESTASVVAAAGRSAGRAAARRAPDPALRDRLTECLRRVTAGD